MFRSVPHARSSALDGMRGLAVLIVFLSHTSGRDMALAPWLQFHGIGHVGVYLFFVLSGYLLTRNLLDGQDVRAFYVRRVFRIAPLYFAVLAGVLAWQALGHYSPRYLYISGGAEGALLHFLFLKGDGVFWTIPAEFLFYLLLPPLVVTTGRFGRRWLAVAAVAYFLWFYAIRVGGWPLPPLRLVDIAHPGQFLDVFLCGIHAAYVRRPLPTRLTAAAFWGLLALTLVCVSFDVLGAGRPWFGLRWLSLLYGIVFAAGLVSAAQGNNLIAAPLRHPVLRFMGVVGFSWYLLHFAVFEAINAYALPSAAKFLLACGLCAVASWSTFQLIERPGMRLGQALGQRLNRAAA